MKTPKKKLEREKQNSPIDVMHGIQEDCGAIPRIHNDAVNGDMLIFFDRVILVNMPPPSRQMMVPLPYKEHLVSKMGKVRVSTEHGIELFICLFT